MRPDETAGTFTTGAERAPVGLLNSVSSGSGSLLSRGDCWREGMATGTVKWFNVTKGYGFIAPDGGGADVFVHVSAVERSGLQGLREGQAVSFDVETDARKNKPSAVNIKPL